MNSNFDVPISLNNKGVELLQRGCCSRQASETFSEAFSSILSRRGSKHESSTWTRPAPLVTFASDISSSSSFHVENLFDRISESGQASRLNQLFDLKSMQNTFSIIRIDENLIDVLPLGEAKSITISIIILYNWAVACLGMAQSQSRAVQHTIYLQALSLLGEANKLMQGIAGLSFGCGEFELAYTQLAISYAFWQAHRWSVGKRFLQSNTNMILYQRYCRFVRKVQILDKCAIFQHQHISASAA